jgi:hypothetical protein
MSYPFDPQQGLIIVRAELWGPYGSALLRLALDTGATATVVNVGMLVAIGYDPVLVPERVHFRGQNLTIDFRKGRVRQSRQ